MASNEAIHALSGVPKGQGLLYTTDGKKTIVNVPFNDSDVICNILNCTYMQMVPATVGALASKAILLMDEEGKMNNKNPNMCAETELGEQVFGAVLVGNILLLHPDDLE